MSCFYPGSLLQSGKCGHFLRPAKPGACSGEGYVYNGQVEVYGVADSIREGKHYSSFSRYQYPSTIPQHIQQKMYLVTERLFNVDGATLDMV